MEKRLDVQQPWYQFIGELDWLLLDIDFTWAQPTLFGIRETVLARRQVSDAQRVAVDRIRQGKSSGVI